MTLNANRNGRFDKLRVKLSWAWLAKRKFVWHRLLRLSNLLCLSKQPRAVFLVGSGRSGTDILAHCLTHSLNVKLINEDNPLAFVNWRLKDLDDVKQVVKVAGAPFVLLKPIVETMRVKEFLEQFPDSRAIFLIRDYRDAINSMVKFFGESNVRAVTSWIESDFARLPLIPHDLRNLARQIWRDYPFVETASGIYWLMYNSSYLFLDLREDSRIYLVNYEKLVIESEDTLQGVCDFLRLQYKEAMSEDIYRSSVKRKPAPNLPTDLQHYCEETWDRLNSVRRVNLQQ